MNNNSQSPLFYILEASPKRYIDKPSATIVMVIRVLEGIVALMLTSRVAGYLSGLFYGTSAGVFELSGVLQPFGSTGLMPPAIRAVLEEQLAGIMPEGESIDSLLQETLGDGDAAVQTLVQPGTFETIITGIGAAALLAVLVCTAAEAVALVFLRFALKGSVVAKIAHKVIYIASLVILLTGICLIIIFANKCRMLGITAALLAGQLRTTAIMIGVCMALLFLRVLYHRDVAKVLSAIDYEIRLGFKETALEVKRLPSLALLFVVLALAGTVIMVIKAGLLSAPAIAMAVLTVKYVMVYTCWGNFRRCHM